MFQSAYLRLTGWYVVIIMAISFLFSGWVYTTAVSELRGGLQHGVIQLDTPTFMTKSISVGQIIDNELVASRQRLVMNIIFFNLGVLIVGAAASYLLAKRTLQPIKQSVEAQNRFTADASHELRTPLAAMKTEIEVALRDKTLKISEARVLLSSNLEEIDRLTGLSQGLLALARTDVEPTLAPVMLSKIVTKVVKRLQPLADAKDIRVYVDVPKMSVLADADGIDNVVGIILENAIKYSPKNSAIDIRAKGYDGIGALTITDHGEGIQPSDLPYIFDRFYRADNARSSGGYGLGLAIAKKIIDSIDGSITATSEPGKGSSFTIKLPISSE